MSFFKQIEPANARGKLKDEMWDSPNISAEEKLDGHRAIAQFCGDATRFTSRRRSVKDGLFVENTASLPHLFTPVPGLLGTVLDGEIVVPGRSNSMKVSSIMGSKAKRAHELQEEHGYVNYVVFDCLFYKGEDARDEPLKARRLLIAASIKKWNNEHVRRVRSARHTKWRFLEKIYAEGGEGVILKPLDSVYHQKYWAKVKREAGYDVVVMGYVDAKEISEKVDGVVSETKYKGMVGAIRFGQYINGKLKEVGQTSGFTDELRRKLTDFGDLYIGLVIEIQAQGRIEKTGKFRHPRFKRWRKDKNPEDCVYRKGEL